MADDEMVWSHGVLGQCDECGDTTVLRSVDDYLDEPDGWLCLPCWTGDDGEDL